MSDSLYSTPNKVAEYIKREIREGRLVVGDKLPSERDLVKQLGVSRSSVREAIKTLTLMGYVEPIHRRGTFISKEYQDNLYANAELNIVFNRAPIFDLMEVRLFLEENFIPLVIKRFNGNDIRKLEFAIEKMEVDSPDISYFFEGDLDFHYALAEATHNIVIIEIMKLVKKRILSDKELFKAAGVVAKDKTIRDFKSIIYHIKNGNSKEAENLYHNHLYGVDKYFQESI